VNSGMTMAVIDKIAAMEILYLCGNIILHVTVTNASD